jgi:hypothetical protein
MTWATVAGLVHEAGSPLRNRARNYAILRSKGKN